MNLTQLLPSAPTDYDKCAWQNLNCDREAPRYKAIAALVAKHGCRSVLDVGCGEAVLASYTPRDPYVPYTGVEPSSAAFHGAHIRMMHLPCGNNLTQRSVEEFDPGWRTYECIVFSEMLYYLADPLAQLNRYRHFLTSGGIFIVTIYQHPVPLTFQLVKRWLRAMFTRFRRSYSNPQCTQMVLDECWSRDWEVLSDTAVPMPGTKFHWRVIAIKP